MGEENKSFFFVFMDGFYTNFSYYLILRHETNQNQHITIRVKNFYPSCLIEENYDGDDIPSVSHKDEVRFLITPYEENPRKFKRHFFRSRKQKDEVVQKLAGKFLVCDHNIRVYEDFLLSHNLYFGQRFTPLNTLADNYYINNDELVLNTGTEIFNLFKVDDSIPTQVCPPLLAVSFDIECLTPYDNIMETSQNTIYQIGCVFFNIFQGYVVKERERILLTLSGWMDDTDDSDENVDKETNTFANIILCDDEKSLLQNWFDILCQNNIDLFIGYNINNYDWVYILQKCKRYDISPRVNFFCDSNNVTIDKREKNILRLIGSVNMDMYVIVQRMRQDLQVFTLDNVSKKLLGEEHGKDNVTPAQIKQTFLRPTARSVFLVGKYCIQDCVLVMKLFEHMRPLLVYWSCAIVGKTNLNCQINFGALEKMKPLLRNEFKSRGYVFQQQLPNKKKEGEIIGGGGGGGGGGKYMGAFVLNPKTGYHPFVYIFDFKSLYPSCMRQGICPTLYLSPENEDNSYNNVPSLQIPGLPHRFAKTRPGIIPAIETFLIQERARVKNAMLGAKDNERHILNAAQESLKIMANSIYGSFGNKFSDFNSIQVAESITGYGRHVLMETKKFTTVTLKKEVIYGDTDSIMVKGNNDDEDNDKMEEGKRIEREINLFWEKHPMNEKGTFEINCESLVRSFLLIQKKKYIGFNVMKQTMLIKGIDLIRHDSIPLVNECITKIVNFFMITDYKVPITISGIIDILQKTLYDIFFIRKPELDDIVQSRKMRTTYKNGNLPHVVVGKRMHAFSGDRIEYFVHKSYSKPSPPLYLRARGRSEVDIKKIDWDYYINMLIMAIVRIFYCVVDKKIASNEIKKKKYLTTHISKTCNHILRRLYISQQNFFFMKKDDNDDADSQ
jgi:DNA polymerase elongation subunit (family B)